MTNRPEKDYVPFPDPGPVSTGFAELDSNHEKDWRQSRRRWEADHGVPSETPEVG